MLDTVKKLFGFKVKETKQPIEPSVLEKAKKEDHDRILEKARREREERDRRERERMRTADSGSDILSNPFHPLNPISPLNNTFYDDDTSTKHRKHDSGFVDSAPVHTSHSNNNYGESNNNHSSSHSSSHSHSGGDSGGGGDGGGGGD